MTRHDDVASSGRAGRTRAWRPGSLADRLPETARWELLTLGSQRVYAPGEVIVREGAGDTFVVLLLRGVAKVTAAAEEVDVLLGIRGAGDLVGELAALTGHPRSATVTACGTVLARVIMRDVLRGFLRRRPDASEQVTAMVGDRLLFANRRRIEFGTLPAHVRLTRVLAELVDAHGGPSASGERQLVVPITHGELATLIGASEDTVHRALARLRRDGLVRTGYRTITVLDPAGLPHVGASS